MTSTHITVVYRWTAKPGKLDKLKSIYEQVTEAMKQNEPDAQAVHCCISEKETPCKDPTDVGGDARPRQGDPGLLAKAHGAPSRRSTRPTSRQSPAKPHRTRLHSRQSSAVHAPRRRRPRRAAAKDLTGDGFGDQGPCPRSIGLVI
jgi:hypothetical protein